MDRTFSLDQLPTVPQVLIRILDAIHGDDADSQRVSEILGQDPAITAKLLDVANTSFDARPHGCFSIEEAILLLGADAVRTIVIATASKQSIHSSSNERTECLKKIWQRSLVTAHFSQALASLTHYAGAHEAYLCGLLSGVGQLMLLTEHEEEYLQLLNDTLDDGARLTAETERFAANHCHQAADLIDGWQISPFMGDAIRYHLEPTEAVRGAHHLVKIVSLAGLLSRQHLNPEPGIDEQVLAAGQALFGITEETIHDLAQRTALAVQTIISGMGLVSGPEDDNDRQARQDMAEQLNLLTGIRQATSQFSKAQSRATLQQAIQRSLLLTFDIPRVLLFAYNDDRQSLEVHLSGQENHGAAFTIPSHAEHSVVAESYLEKAPRKIDASANPSIVDQQLIKYCGTGNLLCLPLNHQHESLGVVAFGLGAQQSEIFAKHAGLARHLASEIAHRIVIIRNNSRSITNNQSENAEVELRINEAVHEASNPLTIILNYLEVLRVKLGLGHEEEENLAHVKEEIERISKILQRLKSPEESGETTGTVQQVIESLTGIFRESLCQSKNISIRLDIDHDTMTATVDDAILKQVLSNLLRNAIEALPPEGEILISTENNVSVGGKANLAIYVQDNGPGIADDIKPLLFSPMKSTKGIGHSGLGLSIVKKLLDEIGGTIVCRSNSDPEKDAAGTQFQILIPCSP